MRTMTPRTAVHVAAALVLLGASASASGTGVLTGGVYKALTHEPIIGATVVVMSSGARDSTDVSGRFMLDSVPESSVVVASAKGFFDERESVQVAAGCTTQTGFFLLDPLGTRPDRFALEPSETLGVHSRLHDRTLHVDTVPWFLNPGDAYARTRSNSTKLALVEHCMGGGIKAAYAKASSDRYMWLATGLGYLGPGTSYLREEVVYKTGRFTRDTLPGYCRVTSIEVGYVDTTQFGGLEFVECAATGPSDEWLVLRLSLLGGGTAYF